jgi:hypothetical protein
MKAKIDSKKIFQSSRGKKNKPTRTVNKKPAWGDNINSIFKIFSSDASPIVSDFKNPQKKPRKFDPNEKVFKPKKNVLLKSKIKENFKNPQKKPAKKFKFGYKKITAFGSRIKSFSFKNLLKKGNYYLVKFGVLDQFNRFTSYLLLAILSIFVIYISFFDTFFLVKTYTINFQKESYLDESQSEKLIQNIHKSKLLGIIPNNSLWFLNGSNYTLTAKKFNPEIKKIKVENRIWPDNAVLNITTEPILLTLAINNEEYWRVSKQAKVISEDTASLRERVVNVKNPVIFDKATSTLAGYNFASSEQQINRFWFIDWLWRNLETKNIKVSQTSIPSLIDNDVIIKTDSGVELYFDTSSISKTNQLNRINEFFIDSRLQEIKDGSYKYVDFRISKRIFVCRKDAACK